MVVAILCVWAARCTPEASPVHESAPEASPVHESAPETSPVHESAPEASLVHNSAPEASPVHESALVPPEVAASAAEPPEVVVPIQGVLFCLACVLDSGLLSFHDCLPPALTIAKFLFTLLPCPGYCCLLVFDPACLDHYLYNNACNWILSLLSHSIPHYSWKHSSEILVHIDTIASRSCCRFVGCESPVPPHPKGALLD